MIKGIIGRQAISAGKSLGSVVGMDFYSFSLRKYGASNGAIIGSGGSELFVIDENFPGRSWNGFFTFSNYNSENRGVQDGDIKIAYRGDLVTLLNYQYGGDNCFNQVFSSRKFLSDSVEISGGSALTLNMSGGQGNSPCSTENGTGVVGIVGFPVGALDFVRNDPGWDVVKVSKF